MGEKPLFYIQTHSINDWSPRDRYEESKAARCCTTGPRAPCITRSMISFSVPGLDDSGLTARGGENHLDIDMQTNSTIWAFLSSEAISTQLVVKFEVESNE